MLTISFEWSAADLQAINSNLLPAQLILMEISPVFASCDNKSWLYCDNSIPIIYKDGILTNIFHEYIFFKFITIEKQR